ncbi:MAG: single-stranded DNA-binding protein [Actinomycetes bacterium]
MNETVVTVVGNVASEVRHTVTPRGVHLASFRVASTPRRFDRNNGWVDGQTSFYSITCWRALAANVASSVRIGEPVVVTGRLKVRPWEKEDGRRGVTVEVDASAVGHDLTRGTSAFVKTSREVTADPSVDRRTAHALADGLADEWPEAADEVGGAEEIGGSEDERVASGGDLEGDTGAGERVGPGEESGSGSSAAA